MSDLPEDLDVLTPMLMSDDVAAATSALEVLTGMKGRSSTKALTDFLRVAPEGLLTTRAAIALETRKHKSCLTAIYEIYQTRPELADDLIPILSALEDQDGIALIAEDLETLFASSARLSTVAYLVKCADDGAVADILLPMIIINSNPMARDDLMWGLEQILRDGDEALLLHVKETAAEIGPEAIALVEPFMPAVGELERQAPNLARSLLQELAVQELIELVPDSEDALVDVLANAIMDARSPKGLIRDVERILMNSTSIDEIYADRNDLMQVFSKIANQ
jgi:hypothetical protein